MEDPITRMVIQNDTQNLHCVQNKYFLSTNYSIPFDPSQNLIPSETLKRLPQKNLGLLHIAALADSLECFIFITRYHKVDPLMQSADRYNPLHYACLGNSIEVAEYILALYPNLPAKDTDTNFQYLYLAVAGNSPTILELLLKHGANLNSPKNKQNNPIDFSVKSKKVVCLKILLQYSSISKTQNKFYTHYSNLMQAIVYSQPAAVPYLLANGEDPSFITQDGQTALSINCFFLRDPEVARNICDALYEVDIPATMNKPAAVHWICGSGSPEIAEIVLRKGINVNRFDNEGKTGPSCMIDKGIPEENTLKILDMLYHHGFDINLRYDEKHNTPLGEFLNAIRLSPKIIDWFLSKGADIDLPFIKTNNNSVTTIRKKILEKATTKHMKEMKEIVEKYHI